jgi:hypothetical protein
VALVASISNPLTGKLETQVNTVHGPTAVFQTTTNPRTDAETRSRFIVVSVDESPEQTREILHSQRQSHTLEGLRRVKERERVHRRHHAFQRLLKPLRVVNPFEPFLTYGDDNLCVRRDNPKYLGLIEIVLHRPLHLVQERDRDESGEDFIETTLDDIAIANELAHELFGHSPEELPHPSRNLLGLIAGYAAKKANGGAPERVTFTRRELREAFKWGDTRLRVHLAELVEFEYLAALSGRFGQTYQYRLLYSPSDEPGRFLAGLKSMEQLRQEANLAGHSPNLAPTNGHLAPTSRIQECEVEGQLTDRPDKGLRESALNLAPFSGGACREKGPNGARISEIEGTEI